VRGQHVSIACMGRPTSSSQLQEAAREGPLAAGHPHKVPPQFEASAFPADEMLFQT
jgi:hypothetical protein